MKQVYCIITTGKVPNVILNILQSYERELRNKKIEAQLQKDLDYVLNLIDLDEDCKSEKIRIYKPNGVWQLPVNFAMNGWTIEITISLE